MAKIKSGPAFTDEYKEDYMSTKCDPCNAVEHVKHWKDANDVFYGPDRDFVNFPVKQIPERDTRPHHFGIVPNTWLMALYPKLGTSGFYTLLWGGTFIAFTKEWHHLDDDFSSYYGPFVCFLAATHFGLLDKAKDMVQEWRVKNYEQPYDNAQTKLQQGIDESKAEIAKYEALPIIRDAKEEILDLQCELIYRDRLANVHAIVKKRLDYMVEVEKTKNSFNKANMIDWVVREVNKNITPDIEKKNLSGCIARLAELAPKPL